MDKDKYIICTCINTKQVLSSFHIYIKSMHLITILFPFIDIDIILLMYFEMY